MPNAAGLVTRGEALRSAFESLDACVSAMLSEATAEHDRLKDDKDPGARLRRGVLLSRIHRTNGALASLNNTIHLIERSERAQPGYTQLKINRR